MSEAERTCAGLPPAGSEGERESAAGAGAEESWDPRRFLPHRYPFLLVDRVVEIEDGVRAVGVKNVSANEPYFAGHFPGRPIMPGVLVCEAMAQVGGILAHGSRGGVERGKLMLLAGFERVRFRRPVFPGDQLRIEVWSVRRRAALWKMRGVATVGGRVVAEAEFSAVATPGPEGAGEEGAAGSPRIHPTALVAPGAELGPEVAVGAHAIVGGEVRVGAGSVIGPHAVVEGRTTLGPGTRIFQFASVGAPPQDLKYRGEPSRLEVGEGTIIREFATLSPGTEGGGMVTRVGRQCLLMISSHVAHDCQLGDGVIVANGAALGGHVVIEDHAIVGALSGVHQFVRIGESALCGAGAMVSMDVPPYCIASGDRARVRGLNLIGLRRRGFSPETVRALKRAYRLLFLSRLRRPAALARVRAECAGVAEVEHLAAFVERSARGVCR